MGAGKSHVSRALVQSLLRKGIPAHHIDVDALAHDILEQDDEPVYRELRANLAQAFGVPTRSAVPFLDRHRLGERALENPDQAWQLNTRLREPLLLKIKRGLADKTGVILLDTALLAETGLSVVNNHRTVLVHAPRADREARLRERGMSPEGLAARQALQESTEGKRGILQAGIDAAGFGETWELENPSDGASRAIDELANRWVEEFHLSEAIGGSAAA
jgi:dephospho-CoA kinase